MLKNNSKEQLKSIKSMQLFSSKIVLLSNLIDLMGVFVVSAAAIIIQLFFHELPCPLCLLQRIGLMAIAYGYVLNILYGNKSNHYAYSTIAAILTSFIALRQILIHIVPGSGYYGDPVFGIHMYTWVFIICMVAIAWNMLIIIIYPEDYRHQKLIKNIRIGRNPLVKLIVFAYIFVIALNFALTFLECGTTQCPDDPNQYMILNNYISK
jgi:disulfide bond formation protein DsbB